MIPIDRPLVITDTETTGLSPVRNRLIEIGATRIVDGEEPISFSQLIDPGESIPYRITRLTGITSSMVVGCPDASEVIPQFDQFLGDGILVAHNLSFDRGFLNAERERLGLGSIQNQGLCTVRLARRLLPGLRSKSLGSLAKFFRIASHGRHRALRDVEITLEVLMRLLGIAFREHNVESLDDILEMQTRTYARINPLSKHIIQIRRDVLPGVPDCPGVYQMQDGRGHVLYVGKAKDLSRRVRSYFNAIEAHTPRIRQLVSKVRGVEWIQTDTELEALLLEARMIRELDPSFNRAQRKTIPRPFLRISTNHNFPKIVANVFPKDDGAEYYGPLRSRGEAQTVLEVIERIYPIRTCSDREFKAGQRCLRADIGKCSAPCEGTVSVESYADQLNHVRDFLAGGVERVIEILQREMEDAAQNLAFEDAAHTRDVLSVIEGRIRRSGRVASRVFEDDAAIIHVDPETETRDVLLIRSGQFAASMNEFDPDHSGSVEALREMITDVYAAGNKKTFELLQDNANEIRVLAQWLYANREKVTRVDRNTDSGVDEFIRQVCGSARFVFSEKKVL
ncbi:MAG: DEDD exonuclease domain-containing protein [Rhodothermia bacterium]|nr:MAG: DEDD exonuclease domain-containing protein [Rhodothermia bacterium]